MTKAIKRFALFVSLTLAIPTMALAASFGTQNFFYAPSNVITPLAGFTTSWGGGASLSGSNSWTGTNAFATTTTGSLNGVIVVDGTYYAKTGALSRRNFSRSGVW